METKHTDKSLLISGLKKMIISLFCMFIGPTLTYISSGLDDNTKKMLLENDIKKKTQQ